MTGRRTILTGVAALAAAPLGALGKSRSTERMSPKTFLLAHGSGHGGWCWEYVAHMLGTGHAVYAPSLTGLGDRYHLHSPQVNLHTHIEDLTDLIDVWIWDSDVKVTQSGSFTRLFLPAGVQKDNLSVEFYANNVTSDKNYDFIYRLPELSLVPLASVSFQGIGAALPEKREFGLRVSFERRRSGPRRSSR